MAGFIYYRVESATSLLTFCNLKQHLNSPIVNGPSFEAAVVEAVSLDVPQATGGETGRGI